VTRRIALALCLAATAACAVGTAGTATPRVPHPLIAAGNDAHAGDGLTPASPEQPLGAADERELAIASLMAERGQYADAIGVLAALHERNPDHAGVLEDLVWACIPAPDCRPRLPGLADALAAHVADFPGDLGRRLTLVDLLEAAGADGRRRRQVAALLRDFPPTAEGWILAAELALADDDLDATAELLARASAREFYDPDNRERLDETRMDLAAAADERRRVAADERRERRRAKARRRRASSRQSFFLRLEDGDDF